MSSGGMQDFKAGEPPSAALFNALVSALRGLLAQQGPLTATHRSGRAMRTFTPSGIAIARSDEAKEPTATASEILWQMGPHVKVLPGGSIGGVKEALEAAGGSAAVEIRAQVEWQQISPLEGNAAPAAWTLEATEATYSAAAMVEPEDDAEVMQRKIVIDTVQAERGVRQQKQRMLSMWPMPQHPCTVYTSGIFRGYTGEYYLLPAPNCEQLLTDAYVPIYYLKENPKQYYACLTGRLDRFGRLQCGSSLFYYGQRT